MKIRAAIVLLIGIIMGLAIALGESTESRLRNLEEQQRHQQEFNDEGTKTHERQDARIDALERTAHVSRIVGDAAIFVVPGIGALTFFLFSRYERRKDNEHKEDHAGIADRQARITQLELKVELLQRKSI